MTSKASLLLKNAHVIDPAQAIDRVTDVAIADGRIEAIGDALPAKAQTLDLGGRYLTPGWIDAHVHAYGSIGFSDLDSIGVCQGVTTVVDAGDAGIATLDQYVALLRGRTITDIYPAPHVNPLGIMGFDSSSGRGINTVEVGRWVEWAEKNPGYLRYLKVSAYSLPTSGPLYFAKGLAETLGLPLYQHIGEMTPEPTTPSMLEPVFRIAQKGDIVTHIYHNNPGRVIDDEGKVLPFVREAERRGVLFDIAFGGLNFSWQVAEKCYAQDLIPHMISSDLQQYNVVYPCRSLANVMSIFLHLGMSHTDVIERVTSMPAKALNLSDRAGSLRVGMPADITVFRLEDGEFELADCYKQTRVGKRRFMPDMAFKAGQRIDCDFARGQLESNWFLQIAEDGVPPVAERLSRDQREFLVSLLKALSNTQWTGLVGSQLNIHDAHHLQNVFLQTLSAHPVSLRDGLQAVFDCFLEHPFTIQIGVFLARLDRPFVLDRLKTVTKSMAYAAA